jgi:hypothetical protein
MMILTRFIGSFLKLLSHALPVILGSASIMFVTYGAMAGSLDTS